MPEWNIIVELIIIFSFMKRGRKIILWSFFISTILCGFIIASGFPKDSVKNEDLESLANKIESPEVRNKIHQFVVDGYAIKNNLKIINATATK